MSAETRAEFRERITILHQEALYESRHRHAPYSPDKVAPVMDAAEAVYAQALRDVLREFGSIVINGDGELLADDLHAWAWHKGIELDVTEALETTP